MFTVVLKRLWNQALPRALLLPRPPRLPRPRVARLAGAAADFEGWEPCATPRVVVALVLRGRVGTSG